MKTTTRNIDTFELYLDDIHIIIQSCGKYDNEKVFLWTTLEPSESIKMEATSEVINMRETREMFAEITLYQMSINLLTIDEIDRIYNDFDKFIKKDNSH